MEKEEIPERKTLTIDPLEAGMIFLITVEPLYALTLLEFDRVKKGGDFPFAAVGRDDAGKLGLYVNVEELCKWNRAQIGYVLAHEMLHIILRHFDRHPEHSELWNVAEDLAINDMLRHDDQTKLFGERMALPGCYPGEDTFADLPRGKTADEYYELLIKNGYKAKKTGKWKIKVTNGKNGSVEVTISPTQKLSKEDKQQIEQVLKEAIKKAAGKISSHLQEHINNFLKDNIDWTRHVQNMIGSVRSIKTRSIYRFSRKYDDAVGSRRTHKLAMIVVTDTSGSVDDEVLRRFGGICENIKRVGGTVTVIECDCAIQKVYDLKSKFLTKKVDGKFMGRGGTSFKPPFQYIREKRLVCDVLVYLTDLEGDFPEGKDIIKNTIWCTVEDHPVPFGKRILIPR